MPTERGSKRRGSLTRTSGKRPAAQARVESIASRSRMSDGLRRKIHHFRLYQTLKVLTSHFDDFRVGAGIEGDVVIVRQRLGYINLHAVKIAEGRHGAGFAIGEFLFEFFFGGELDFVRAGDFPQILQDDLAIGRQDGHGHLAIQFDDDGLGEFLAGDMRGGGDLLRSVGGGMNDTDVLDPLLIEESFQSFYWHDVLLSNGCHSTISLRGGEAREGMQEWSGGVME